MTKKKILYIPGHSRSTFKWGMVGELAKRLLENENNEVYYLDCNNTINTPCGLNTSRSLFYCKKCSGVCKKLLKMSGLKDENILKMKKFKAPNFPDFKTIEEAINYEYEGYNYGLGPISCIMSLTRDYDFDLKKWQGFLKKYFKTQYIIFKNLEELYEKYKFDEIHTFNGRMPSMYPAVSYARKNNIPYYIYERGANINKHRTICNNVPHDFNYLKEDIKTHWENGTEGKEELAKKWFDDRRAGKYQALHSYTKDQIKDLLPKGFDFNKENIAIFNSSIDEIYAFDSWKHPFAKNENEVLAKLFEHYKNDLSKHFYLRIHPNLAKAKKNNTSQIKELEIFKNKYKNVTIIEPDDKIDSYALIEAVDKVVVSYSTVGCEATYWGKVAIIAGKSPYEDLDCAYKANSLDELYSLIDNKTLIPKPKENTYPYGYRNQVYGEENRYYKAISHNEGEFLGLKLSDK